jgi:hypothetical protein
MEMFKMGIETTLVETGLKVLKQLASHPEMVGELLEKTGKMPNIKMKTLGGKVFWKNLVVHNGWKLQKNDVFGNCRILNPENKRIAWGGESEMVKLMESIG